MPRARDDFDSTSYNIGRGPNRTLTDLCTDAFMLVFHITGGSDLGQIEDLKKDIALLLQNIDREGKRSGYADEDIKATRYALCAILDEMILNSRWEFKDQWSDRPLQLEHFGEHMAGERFFDLLDRIRQKGSRKADLLEVFCIALILGFHGKYKLRGEEELNRLIREIAGEVQNYRGGTQALSPHWKITEEYVEQPVNRIPRWFWITGIASIGAVILCFIIFKLVLNSQVGAAVTRMSY